MSKRGTRAAQREKEGWIGNDTDAMVKTNKEGNMHIRRVRATIFDMEKQ